MVTMQPDAAFLQGLDFFGRGGPAEPGRLGTGLAVLGLAGAGRPGPRGPGHPVRDRAAPGDPARLVYGRAARRPGRGRPRDLVDRPVRTGRRRAQWRRPDPGGRLARRPAQTRGTR